jgi:hypothetical protein
MPRSPSSRHFGRGNRIEPGFQLRGGYGYRAILIHSSETASFGRALCGRINRIRYTVRCFIELNHHFFGRHKMSKQWIFVSALAISGAMLLGCDWNSSDTPATGTGTNTTVDGVTKSAGDAAKQAGEAAKQAGEAAQQAGEKAASDMAATAKGMIEQVETFIKDNKFTDAKAILDKLEPMKAQLPQDLQDKIAALAKTVTEKLGSLPNMGK